MKAMTILRTCFIRNPEKQNNGMQYAGTRSSIGKNAVLLPALAVLFLVSVSVSLFFGNGDYRTDIFRVLSEGDAGNAVYRIFFTVRLPRTLAAAAAGASLSVSGALLQTVLNNGMASPNVIGINSGAGFAMMLSAVLFPWQSGVQAASAFVGAEAAAMMIYLLSMRIGISRSSVILTGLAVSGILTAGMNAVKVLDPNLAAGSAAFYAGSFSGVTMKTLATVSPYAAAGMILALFLSGWLDVLSLGEESAAGLGLPVRLTRFLAILSAALLAGSAVSYAGLLSFAGLLVPHIVRKLVGTNHMVILTASMLMGASLTVLSDTFARTAFAPYELPAGIILSAAGGIFFLFLLTGRKGRRVYD